METKVLLVAVVQKEGKVLMRKKPDGSPPYTETWYLFGATLTPGLSIEEALGQELQPKAGINITIAEKISWDTEVKHDLDGAEKFFVYLDIVCDYASGELIAGEGIERLEWVGIDQLSNYDIVPPSRVLFEKLGYL